MAYSFPRHQDGSLDFEAFERLSLEYKENAVIDIRDNCPSDFQTLEDYFLNKQAFHDAQMAQHQKNISQKEQVIADLEEKKKHLSHQYDQYAKKFATDFDQELRTTKKESCTSRKKSSNCTIL